MLKKRILMPTSVNPIQNPKSLILNPKSPIILSDHVIKTSGVRRSESLPFAPIIAIKTLNVAILDERVLPWSEHVWVLENPGSDGEPLFRFN